MFLVSRRRLVASALAAGVVASAPRRLKIVAGGGHPGDPECGCGGTIARYSALGHEVVLLYLNRGEGYCQGRESSQCGAIRTAEAQKACRILKARAEFASQIDGQAVVDNAHYASFREVLAPERADILLAPWPIDKHRDHRALAQLMLDAWLASGRKAAFYYYEVAEDTMMFSPADYVDISSGETLAARRAACYAHVSQQPDKWFPKQEELTRFRGLQSGYAQAEGFVRHWQSSRGLLL
jgi:LmbE family N-acetylglucosaminyl deacetylase